MTRGLVRSAIAIGVGGKVFAGSTDRTLAAIGERRSGGLLERRVHRRVSGLPRDGWCGASRSARRACGGPRRVRSRGSTDRFLATRPSS